MSNQKKVFSQKEIDLLISQLEKDYPKCFNLKEPKALKLRIHKDILERNPNIPKRLLSRALGQYTHCIRYAIALSNPGFRVDLDGNQAQAISDDHIKRGKILYMIICKRNRDRKKEAKESTPPL